MYIMIHEACVNISSYISPRNHGDVTNLSQNLSRMNLTVSEQREVPFS